MKYLSFSRDGDAGEALLDWWRGLDKDRGGRAELRRCRSCMDVAFVPAFHRLRYGLLNFGYVDAERLALVAGVLAHVRNDDPSLRFAQQMGSPKEGSDHARISGLRFRRLLQIDDRDELLTAMVRVVRLLGGSVDIPSLTKGIYWWSQETKKGWAFDYYEKAQNEA